MKIAWTPKSLRSFKRLVRKNPQLRIAIAQTLRQLENNCYHPSLRTHKLTGNLVRSIIGFGGQINIISILLIILSFAHPTNDLMQ